MDFPTINYKELIKQGHHVGELLVINYSKNAIDQVIGMAKTVVAKGTDVKLLRKILLILNR